MAPVFKHGRNAAFSITTTTGGTIAMSSGLSDVSLKRDIETADVTVMGKIDKQYIIGMRDATFSVSGFMASTFESRITPLLGWSSGTSFVYGPFGTTSGSPKFTGKAHITSYEASAAVGDPVGMSLEFQVTGSITSTHY